MQEKKIVRLSIWSILIILFLVGCAAPATTSTPVLPMETPTPLLPTETLTPVPPTETPIPVTPTETLTPIPPTPTSRPPYLTTGFPTGKFASTDADCKRVEFLDNGIGRWTGPGWEVGDRYGVLGNIWAEMTFNDSTGRQVPVTYYWSFDGYDLSFQPLGIDFRPHRKKCLGLTYTYAGELPSTSSTGELAFPTGRLVSEDGVRAFEFDADGAWRFYENDLENPAISGLYITNKNYYTELTHDDPDAEVVPATYSWRIDDQRLTFKLWGEDDNEYRRSIYDEQTYIKVDE